MISTLSVYSQCREKHYSRVIIYPIPHSGLYSQFMIAVIPSLLSQ